MRTIRFEHLRRDDFKTLDARSLAVLPIAATEQHGPHLPVGTDSLILDTVLGQAAEKCIGKVIVVPSLRYGYSPHHFSFPGVLSLRSETLLSVLKDLGDSIIHSGFKKVLLITAHGGNSHLIAQAARDISNSHEGVLAVATSYWDIAMESLVRIIGSRTDWIPGHAGLVESAMIMAIHQNLVDETESNRCRADQMKNDRVLAKALINRCFVERSDYIRLIDGYSDTPNEATAEIGTELIAAIVTDVINFLNELYEHP